MTHIRTISFALFLLLFVAAAESFTFHFDGAPPTRNDLLTADWCNNKTASFAPYGQALLVDDPFGTYKKALKLTSEGKNVEVYTTRALPVKCDGKLRLQAIFHGTGRLRVGIYGYDTKGAMSEYQAVPLIVDSKAWDQRQQFYAIRKPETVSVRPFVSVVDGDSMVFAELKVDVMPLEAAYLLPSHNLELWQQRTTGTNLALGKKLSFDPMPNYTLTKKNGTDATDLTDGKFNNVRDQLWFDPMAVAWFNSPYASITLDLGSVQPVRKAVIRICGGRLAQNCISFPAVLQTYVSKDGLSFHQASSMMKLKESEYELANWKTHFFLKESADNQGIPYVYPFELPINADARFVVVRAPQPAYWVTMACDELAVIKEDAPENCQNYNTAYRNTAEDLFHKELRIRPRLEQFYVPDNMDVPNFLIVEDRNPDKNGKITYAIDLPDAIRFTDDTRTYPRSVRLFETSVTEHGRTTHHFKTSEKYERFLFLTKTYRFGPFWFKADPAKPIPQEQMYARFITAIDGKEHAVVRLPLKIISIPQVPQQAKRFKTLIDYRTDQALGWPNFLDTQRRLGMGSILFLMPHSLTSKDAKTLYHQAKQEGFTIRHFTVPTLWIHGKYRNVPDYHCIGMPSDKYGFCPAYRGKFYQEILDMITQCVRELPPDFVTFEDECWQPVEMDYSLDCSRCQKTQLQKGLDPKRFMQWIQADFLSAYKTAVANATPDGKYIPIGHYVLNPYAPGYACRLGNIPHLGGFDLFPKDADELHMSYYGRDPREMQKVIRTAFKGQGNTACIMPFLTGGTGSYTEGPMFHIPEQLIMEAIMNGASGFELYHFHSLESPLDYTYIATAMKQLLPFEEFLMNAPLADVECSNRNLAVTCRTMNGEMLLLLGNYGASKPAETTVTLQQKPDAVTDAVTGYALPADRTLTVAVPPDAYRFIHVKMAH